MKLLLFPFLLFAFFFKNPNPEYGSVKKIIYTITQKGKPIGSIKAVKTTKGDEVDYDVETMMDVKVLLTQHIKYHSAVRYKAGKLLNSLSKSYVNGKLHQTCNVTRSNEQYHVQTDKQTNIIDNEITYSGTMLYFIEPKNINTVFSEMTGQVNTIKKATDANFILTDAKSKKQNYYWYKNGILDKAHLSHALVDIEIKRTN